MKSSCILENGETDNFQKKGTGNGDGETVYQREK